MEGLEGRKAKESMQGLDCMHISMQWGLLLIREILLDRLGFCNGQ